MRNSLISLVVLILLVPKIGTAGIGRDKFAHGFAGYSIALTCNVGLNQVVDENLSTFQRAWFCTLVSFAAGGMWEFVQRRSSKPDPNDVLATGIGGAAAGLFTITIDF